MLRSDRTAGWKPGTPARSESRGPTAPSPWVRPPSHGSRETRRERVGKDCWCCWKWRAQSPRSSLRVAGSHEPSEGRSSARVGPTKNALECPFRPANGPRGAEPPGRKETLSARKISGETPSAEGSYSQPSFISSPSLNLPFEVPQSLQNHKDKGLSRNPASSQVSVPVF